jgi:hypothetical protein
MIVWLILPVWDRMWDSLQYDLRSFHANKLNLIGMISVGKTQIKFSIRQHHNITQHITVKFANSELNQH